MDVYIRPILLWGVLLLLSMAAGVIFAIVGPSWFYLVGVGIFGSISVRKLSFHLGILLCIMLSAFKEGEQ